MKYPIELTKNCNDDNVYAFNINDTLIYNPMMSECGRFAVNPLKHYGLENSELFFLHYVNFLYGFDDCSI
jgi:hypothetical protein